MAPHPAAATYRRELSNGLFERWSTQEDTELIADLCGRVFSEKNGDSPNLTLMASVRAQMSGSHFLMGPGDYAVVEDPHKRGNPLVACTCLWRSRWEYDGISFGLGQPEYVASDPAYRRQGLIRGLFQMLHARSEDAGDLVQAITGIPHFYRQFGYEYALELQGSRDLPISLIPPASEPDTWSLRAATPEDLPQVMEWYNLQRRHSLVSAVADEPFWRFQMTASLEIGQEYGLLVLADGTDKARGYVLGALKRWSHRFMILDLNLAPGVNWQATIAQLLRLLLKRAQQVPAEGADIGPLHTLSFRMGSQHPVYEAIQPLGPAQTAPYAWYVRVPNLPAFLNLLAPALERHLQESPAAFYTGELRLDLYRGGLRLIFDHGRLRLIEPWQPPAYANDGRACIPALVFLQLLFGYRSLDELRYAFPDIETPGENEALLKGLFPKRFSRVMPLG